MLGPVQVRRDGSTLGVPAGKASELLVRLAVDAGVHVRADRLLDDLWPDDLATRRNTLQSKITMLRRSLGKAEAIAHSHEGYRLVIDAAAVDAIAVVEQAAAAARLFEEGDIRGALDASAAGLALFNGDLLPSAGSGDWVAPHRARFEETQTRLLETWFSARAGLGEVGDLIGDLELAVAAHPFQETLWQLLITALYRAGRQADALATYQRVRDRLADDLGLDAGPQLQALERQILTHDPALLGQVTPAADPGSAAAPISVAGNLPVVSADLVGRESALDAVTDLLGSGPLVNVVGPGGIGKTALAIEVARRSPAPDGAWLARLETAVSQTDVIDTVVGIFGAGGEAALFERLSGSSALLILDNCEHVIEAAADLVVRLLEAAPGLRVLCTSQVNLGIEGEAMFHLEPLVPAASVELFTRLARAQRNNQQLSSAGDTILELCRSLDGLPLAIELAAARTRSLSIDEIVRRLDDRLDVLSDPSSRRPERRRALRSTISWSYELLFPDDQLGLWALATFAGGAPLAGVEFVLDALEVPPRAAVDVIDRLVSRSLVIVDHDDGAVAPRYRLLDSIRAFALEAMHQASRSDRALGAHAAWFAGAARTSTAGVRSGQQGEHLAFARIERANIDAALSWCADHDPLVALDLVNGFGWAWVVLGDSRGAERLVAALDAAGDGAPAPDRASALLLAAWIEASMGDLEQARSHIESAQDLAAAIGDVEIQARAAYYLAYVVSHDGEFDLGLELTDQSARLYDGLQRPWDEAANGMFAARAAIYSGDARRGKEALDRVAHLLGTTVDDPWLRVRHEGMSGELARIEHRFDDAVAHLSRATDLSGRLGFRQTQAYQMSSLGRAQCLRGDEATGVVTLQRSIGLAESIGDVRMAALARVHLARILRGLGDVDQARRVIESSMAWHRAVGGGEQAALGECLLAAMDAADGVSDADGRLQAVLAAAREAGDAHVEVFALDAIARVRSSEGNQAEALALCDRADARMAAASTLISERDRVDAQVVRGAG